MGERMTGIVNGPADSERPQCWRNSRVRSNHDRLRVTHVKPCRNSACSSAGVSGSPCIRRSAFAMTAGATSPAASRYSPARAWKARQVPCAVRMVMATVIAPRLA
jgi:hypothetical protein